MPAPSKLDQFVDLLRELFQFDVADLDFGVYRILNEKRDDIERFIENDLVDGVRAELDAFEEGQREMLEERVDEARTAVLQNLSEDAILPDGSVKEQFRAYELNAVEEYEAAREQLKNLELAEETEERIYDDLARFFNRFYEGGDFVTKRRFAAGDSKYYVPYNGEEVLLHWANRNQYYVKTTEHFRDYRFSVRGVDVHFKLIDAETPQDNVKASDTRYFVLEGPEPVTEQDGAVRVQFGFRALTEEEDETLLACYNDVTDSSRKTSDRSTIVTATVQQILDAIDDATVQAKLTEPEGDRANGPLYTHLNRYTAKHTADYFIHKDLKGFLNGQLRFYIQNEVLRLQEVLEAATTRQMHQVGRARAVRKIGERIIEFLAQIENFQKRLFEKKKFVVDTGYCVTLDRVPEALYDAILDSDAQLQEWQDLYAVDAWENGLFSQGYDDGTFTRTFLEENPHIMIDTRHFGDAFVDTLLDHLSTHAEGGLDEAIDGRCIQGENFQALNLLQERFQEKVDCVYIDPPYNTGGDGFLYKDTYRHSSWMSMMADRIRATRGLMPGDSVLFANVDDNEHDNLRKLLNQLFGASNFVANVIWQKKYSPANDAKWFSDDHDHLVVYAQDKMVWRPTKLPRTEEQDQAYSNPDNHPKGLWKASDYTSNKSASERPNLYYPIENPHTGEKVMPSETRVWAYSPEKHAQNIEEDRVWWGEDGKNSMPAYKRFLSEMEGVVPRTVWTYDKAGHNQSAVRTLKSMFEQSPFPSPKPTKLLKRVLQVGGGETVLDYFAGSGTTGHAVIEMNRDAAEDDLHRRYLMVEMGDHFDNVMLPRLKKAVFSSEWKDGVPQSRDGLRHVIQYHRLESYEDALNNIAVQKPDTDLDLMDRFDDYAIRYMLNTETKESETLLTTDAFERPFDYTLQIQHGMKSPTAHSVDLEATFNYLIGIHVDTRCTYTHQDRRYVVVTGTVEQPQSIEKVMVVWRNQDGLALKDEQTWAADALPAGPFDRVYVNGKSHIHNQAEPLEITFRQRMDPAAR